MIEYPYLHESGKIPASLAGVPFLSTVSGDCVDQVLSHTSIVECSDGDILLEEGETGSANFFILVRGGATVSKAGEEVARIESAGELIGEKAILGADSEDQGRSATVTASGHSFFIKVKADYLDDLSESERQSYDAVLYRFIAGVMAERLAQANARIAELERQVSGS